MAGMGFAPLMLLLCAVAARTSLAMYSKSDAVVELNESNFNKLVMQPEGVAIVEFYAPW